MSPKYSDTWFLQNDLGTNQNCVGLIKVRSSQNSQITSLRQVSINLHAQAYWAIIERSFLFPFSKIGTMWGWAIFL